MPTSELLDKPRLDVPPVWPPDDDGGGGGGGGEPDDAGRGRPGPGLGMGRLGVLIVIVSVGMIFFAFLSTWVMLRLDGGVPPDVPTPSTALLGLGTALITASGVAAALAVRSERRGHRGWVGFLALALAAGLGFCAAQAALWRDLLRGGAAFEGDEYAGSFFAITALHLAHVIGGLVYLAVVLVRGLGRTEAAGARDALANCTLYWHFVGVLWLALLAALALT